MNRPACATLLAVLTLLAGCAGDGALAPAVLVQGPADSEITARVQAALREDDLVGARPIGVVTQDGEVTLHGRVSGREANRAISVTRATPGVRWVISRLEIGQ